MGAIALAQNILQIDTLNSQALHDDIGFFQGSLNFFHIRDLSAVALIGAILRLAGIILRLQHIILGFRGIVLCLSGKAFTLLSDGLALIPQGFASGQHRGKIGVACPRFGRAVWLSLVQEHFSLRRGDLPFCQHLQYIHSFVHRPFLSVMICFFSEQLAFKRSPCKR